MNLNINCNKCLNFLKGDELVFGPGIKGPSQFDNLCAIFKNYHNSRVSREPIFFNPLEQNKNGDCKYYEKVEVKNDI